MLPFSYPVTNNADTGLILEVSCDNKFWPMDPKSKRNQRSLKRNRERASGASCSSSYKAISCLSFVQSSHLRTVTSQDTGSQHNSPLMLYSSFYRIYKCQHLRLKLQWSRSPVFSIWAFMTFRILPTPDSVAMELTFRASSKSHLSNPTYSEKAVNCRSLPLECCLF